MVNSLTNIRRLQLQLGSVLVAVFISVFFILFLYERYSDQKKIQADLLVFLTNQLAGFYLTKNDAPALSIDSRISQVIDRARNRFGIELFIVNKQGIITQSGSGSTELGIVDDTHLKNSEVLNPLAAVIEQGPQDAVPVELQSTSMLLTSIELPANKGWAVALAEPHTSTNPLVVFLILFFAGITAFFMTSRIFITYIRRLQKGLLTQSITDPMTQLPNRQGFDMAVQSAVTKIKRQGEGQLSAMILSFENLVSLTSETGSRSINIILKQLASDLRRYLHPSYIICRGDTSEFIILMPEAGEHSTAELVQTIKTEFSHREFKISDFSFSVKVEFGVTTLQANDTTIAFVSRLYQSLQASRSADNGLPRVAH